MDRIYGCRWFYKSLREKNLNEKEAQRLIDLIEESRKE